MAYVCLRHFLNAQFTPTSWLNRCVASGQAVWIVQLVRRVQTLSVSSATQSRVAENPIHTTNATWRDSWVEVGYLGTRQVTRGHFAEQRKRGCGSWPCCGTAAAGWWSWCRRDSSWSISLAWCWPHPRRPGPRSTCWPAPGTRLPPSPTSTTRSSATADGPRDEILSTAAQL